MKTLRSGILGIMAAVLSGLFVFGILSVAVVEGMITIPPTATIHPTLLPPNLTPIPVPGVTTTTALLSTSTMAPLPTQCPPPVGWQPYLVQPGDSLAELADRFGISLRALMDANCLISNQLVANAQIFLPPAATATATTQNSPTACIHPPGWIQYTIRSGDTLVKIAMMFSVSYNRLVEANCLTDEYIIAGEKLWVPNVATSTLAAPLTATFTQTQPPAEPTRTRTPTLTATSSEPTWTHSPTIPTPTDTPTVTETPVPSETPTITPTDTPNPGQTKKVPTGTNTSESAS